MARAIYIRPRREFKAQSPPVSGLLMLCLAGHTNYSRENFQPVQPQSGCKRIISRQSAMPVLLTNAIRRLSGDQDGTLIVPWPP